jgi:hypothetical protein
MSGAPRAGRPFRWYLGGHAAWFTSFGIQMILFPWLVAVVLQESAQRVGIAQMAVMAPAIVFMLYGGAVADRADWPCPGPDRSPSSPSSASSGAWARGWS